MAQERPDKTSREEQVRSIGPDDPVNRAAVEAIAVIEESLGTRRGEIEFSIIPFFYGSPFFTVEPISGGMGGINVGVACLGEKEGQQVYQERNLALKFGTGDVDNPGKFLDALKAESIEEIRFSFNATSRNITEDSEGRIVFQGVKVASWKEDTSGKFSILR